MELNEAIRILRKKKNISIDECTYNNMSRASYTRFTSGKSDLYSGHLIELLDRLHIELSELQFICNGYTKANNIEYFNNIRTAFENGNVSELKFIKNSCLQNYTKYKNNFFNHMVGLADILIARLEKKEINVSTNELYKYLISTETWSHYELVLFNNSLFFFNLDCIHAILDHAIQDLKKLDLLNPYGNESFRLIINVIITCYKNKNYNYVIKYINMLEKYELPEEHMYERFLKMLFIGIKYLILDDTRSEKQLSDCLFVLDFLGDQKLKNMCKNLISDVKI